MDPKKEIRRCVCGNTFHGSRHRCPACGCVNYKRIKNALFVAVDKERNPSRYRSRLIFHMRSIG